MKEQESYKVAQKVKHSRAFNISAMGGKKVWKNQHATGYKFSDGSVLKVFPKRNLGIKKHLVTGQKRNFWCGLEAFTSNGYGILSTYAVYEVV